MPFDEEGFNEHVTALYGRLLQMRTRFASLAPLTPRDLDLAAQVMHEVFVYMLGVHQNPSDWPLSAASCATLETAARNRDLDLYVMVVAVLSAKAAKAKEKPEFRANQMDAIADALDALTFEHGITKTALLELFRDLKEDLAKRIAWIKANHVTGYNFPKAPELYRDRRNKKEKPDEFFRRVYAPHVPRGMTQADIRRVDPAFYNGFHVWCARHEKHLSHFVPPRHSSQRYRRSG